MIDWRTERDWVAFDLEIKQRIEDLPKGWSDHINMGISCGVAWDNRAGRIRVFTDSNIGELTALLDSAKIVVGFNHIRFDYRVMLGEGYSPPLSRPVIDNGSFMWDAAWPIISGRVDETGGEQPIEYLGPNKLDFDLLIEVWRALKKEPKFEPKTHGGYGLNAVAKETLGPEFVKVSNGAEAPVMYQTGRWGELIDYCVQDVALTRDLFLFAQRHGYVVAKAGPLKIGLGLIPSVSK